MSYDGKLRFLCREIILTKYVVLLPKATTQAGTVVWKIRAFIERSHFHTFIIFYFLDLRIKNPFLEAYLLPGSKCPVASANKIRALGSSIYVLDSPSSTRGS